jgi:hypothetical protein
MAKVKRQGGVTMDVRSPAAAAHTAVEMESETAGRMAEAATTFLGSLTGEQQARALFSLENEERLNWHYIPRERRGLSLKEMDGSQRKLFHALLSSGLSRHGYAKALDIMSLESILGELEGPARRYPRDPDLYYVTLFGTPSDESPWGWRVEGHHLSANFLVVRGNRIAPTPNFFGANPARVPQGPLTGLRVLVTEEDLARQLLASLDAEKQARAIIDSEAPADIITTAEPRVKIDDPRGIAGAEMTEDQKRLLVDLVVEYTSRMPKDVADTRMDQIEKEGKTHIHFAWAGSKEKGQGHYYRVHGPSFLIEYDNTQNNANHIHTVWRDLKDDWGEDLLRGHYAKSH